MQGLIDLFTLYLFYGASVVILSLLFFYDLRSLTLPLPLTVSLYVLGSAFSYITHSFFIHFIHATCVLLGFLVFYGVCFFIYKREAIGLGDGLLLIGLTQFYGLFFVSRVLFFSGILGGLVSLYLLFVQKKDRHCPIPLGSILCGCAILYLISTMFL